MAFGWVFDGAESAVSWSPSLRLKLHRLRWMLKARVGEVLTDASETGPQFRAAAEELRSRGPLGDHLEFGVFQGTSLIAMRNILDQLGLQDVRSLGFDSFQGLPIGAEHEDGGAWREGDFACDLGLVRQRMAEAGVDEGRVSLVKGWFDDTLTDETKAGLGLRKASLIMIDADLYSSSKLALNFCADLIRDEAFIFFDDWHSDHGKLVANNLGQHKAFHEFMAENPALQHADRGDYRCFGRLAGKVMHVRRMAARAMAWILGLPLVGELVAAPEAALMAAGAV